MDVSDNGGGHSTALTACKSCKTRKIRCDKALPKCSSCVKRRTTCAYGTTSDQDVNPNSAATGNRQGHDYAICQEASTFHSLDTPTILFLDPDILRHGQVQTLAAPVPVPEHILSLIGGLANVKGIASKFFEHVHSWMPFISRKRCYDVHFTPAFCDRADVVLLILALRLITTLPSAQLQNPRNPLYYTVKHFYSELETSSMVSILVLQAGVLVTLYELGHGIYPAAFLTIGACARYAHVMGIGVKSRMNTSKVVTLLELEERRRVWWAIIILDRFISIGSPGRPFAIASPQMHDLLPVGDETWDQGIVRKEDSLPLSSPLRSHMSRYALLCQAASLLSRVLEHHTSSSTPDKELAFQLDSTLRAMLSASSEVDAPDSNQISFIYSTILALHSPWLAPSHLSPNPADAELMRLATQSAELITAAVRDSRVNNFCFMNGNSDDISPWGLYFAYRLCCIHTSDPRPTPANTDAVRILKDGFVAASVRWNVAGMLVA